MSPVEPKEHSRDASHRQERGILVRNRTRIAATTLSVLGMSAMALNTTAPSATAATATHRVASVVSHSVSSASAQATLAYWTPARLQAAKVVSEVVTKAPRLASPAVAKPNGKAGAVAGGLPAGVSGSASAAHAASAVTPAAFSYPFPYDSFTLPNGAFKRYPFKENGAIFFVNDGSDFACSGTTVAGVNGSADENEVWTAGHCVANTEGGNEFDSSAIFIPAYNGSLTDFDPFGEFVAYDFETTTAWINNGDFSEDMGSMLVGNSSKKHAETLGDLTGWEGFAWNQNVNEQFVTFGYPVAAPYNGNSMVEDIAATAVSDTGIGGAGPAPTGIGSPLTPGSSGGAWNIDWSESGPGYINGENDYKYPSTEPDAMYSPYFTSLANTVRCFGASSC
jgi:hypothetical protein